MHLSDNKILIVGPTPPPNGGARLLTQEFLQFLDSKNASYHHVPMPAGKNFFQRMLNSAILILRICWYLPRSKTVVLFATTPVAVYLGPVVFLLCRIFRKRSILRKFGGRFDLTYAELSRVKRFLLNSTTMRMDLLLFETQALSRFFEERVGSNCRWHANCRDMPTEETGASQVHRKAFLYLGHVRPCKGIREIIAAAKLCPEVSIDVYGPLRFGVEESEFQNSGNLNYLGPVEPSEVLPTMKKYDALLIPTYCRTEGYPGVILEAYCAGIPVITTDWNAIGEIVEHEVSGLLVEPQCSESLASAISRMSEDQELCNRLRKGAIQKRADYSNSFWYQKLLDWCSVQDSGRTK